MIKKGDTLVEVTLAVGIFSMVAIAVVAVMSGGTSNTQTALETTLAREEIDIQAETLRFIQASAAAEGASNGLSSKLWGDIADKAIAEEDAGAIYHFSPTSCSSIYPDPDDGEPDAFLQNAFFIDPEKLQDENDREKVVISYSDEDNRNLFRSTSTYPRIYDGNAEGIFVVAVKDSGTKILSPSTSGISSENGVSYYYDFYIRTCWDSPGSDRPSTISTVIRLLGK